jgi:hypothetical protein
MDRVEIDLNVRDTNGFTRTRVRSFQEPVTVGDTVIVFEPDEDVETTAIVRSLSADGRFAYLDVDWNGLHAITGVLVQVAETYSPASHWSWTSDWLGILSGTKETVVLGA